MTNIQKRLFEAQDLGYKKFQSALLPTINPETVIGARTPQLRQIVKELSWADKTEFILALPHDYYDENLLHSLILTDMDDFSMSIDAVNHFLPFVDNWAVCDQLRPKTFKDNRAKLLPHVVSWIISDNPFTIRYGIEMLMLHFLGEDFSPDHLRWVTAVKSDEYYVKMAAAWYFATALSRQPEAALPYIEQYRLRTWTHNKAIQKAIESHRIPKEMKKHLRQFKVAE